MVSTTSRRPFRLQHSMPVLTFRSQGLLKLYGADYFTEEEFIKIDGLIHKGRYVFTSGPPKHMYDMEELMSFDESPEEMKPINVQPNSIQSFESSKKDVVVESDEHIPSPNSSESTDIHLHMEETPHTTSAEASSDDETAPPPTTSPAEAAPMFDFSEPTSNSSIEQSEPKPQPQTSNGLPPGITQQQLDEARSMQAAMTKAGQKTRPKYSRHEEPKSEPAWGEDLPSEPPKVEEAYPSPAPSERDTRISDWASEVNAHQPTSRQIASPAPAKKPIDLAPLVEQYVKLNGRKPKSINDVYQPNNPAHYSNRPGSVISATSTKTSKNVKTTKTTKTKIAAKNGLTLGSTYIAHNSQFKSSHVVIDVKAGDHIKVHKYVSGIMWVGRNLRTNLEGQFSEEIFKASPTQDKTEPQKPAENASVAPSVTSSTIRNGLENVEGLNAAEWDEVPVARQKPAAPAPVRPAFVNGLASSRFSVPAGKEEPKPQAPPIQQAITPDVETEVRRVLGEKVNHHLPLQDDILTNS